MTIVYASNDNPGRQKENPMKNYLRLFVLFITLSLFILDGCLPSDRLDETTSEASTPISVVIPTSTKSILPTELPESLPSATPKPVTITTAVTSPTSTITSPVTTDLDMGRLVFARYEYYGWFDLVAEDSSRGLNFEATDEYHKFTSRELINGPGQATFHVFSHYSDRIAFWKATTPGELWISDVAYQNPQTILIDSDGRYVPPNRNLLSEDEYLKIIWSPDDLHLFFYSLYKPELSRVYHIETGQLEAWYWQCHSLIVSTKSDKLATLCTKIDGALTEKEKYAVLEWGGEIWFSETLPGDLFLEPLADGTAFWQWSADGQQVAYFDSNDPDGNLFIADIQGNIRRLLPGVSLFQDSEIAGYQQYEFLSEETPFIWSRDGSLLFVNGFGQTDSFCPPLISEESDPPLILTWDCWQAVDIDTGQVIWSEASLLGNLSLDGGDESTLISVNDLTIAPNGRFVAVYGTINSYPVIVIVDLQTSQVVTISQFERFKRIYWSGQ